MLLTVLLSVGERSFNGRPTSDGGDAEVKEAVGAGIVLVGGDHGADQAPKRHALAAPRDPWFQRTVGTASAAGDITEDRPRTLLTTPVKTTGRHRDKSERYTN